MGLQLLTGTLEGMLFKLEKEVNLLGHGFEMCSTSAAAGGTSGLQTSKSPHLPQKQTLKILINPLDNF